MAHGHALLQLVEGGHLRFRLKIRYGASIVTARKAAGAASGVTPFLPPKIRQIGPGKASGLSCLTG
jgi:hypothetical protein